MRSRNITNISCSLALLVATGAAASAQTSGAPTVSRPSHSAVSPNLSDLPTAHWAQGQELKMVPAPKPLPPRGAGPGGTHPQDGALQHEQGPHLPVNSKTKFGGIGASGYIPPDPNIAVGKTDPVSGVGYIVQLVNSQMAVFNKSGGLVTGPVSLSSLWSSLPGGGGCAANNAGDPVVQYDASAFNGEGRWLITQLGSTSGPTYSECFAVSQTKNPSGAYFLYSYPFGNNLNDYPKFGVWPTATNSAYLASYNMFANGQTFAGAQLCAYNRDALLRGDTLPPAICFLVADGNFLPSDLDGPTPPNDGTPGYFLNFETGSSLRLYQLAPDFTTTPTAPTATLTQVTPDLTVTPFTQACNGGACIPQPNNQKLDSLGDRLMYRLAYRMFGDHASMVVNHSVTAGSSVGVRWYELRQSAASSPQCASFTAGAFYVCQQGTFAPTDGAYRWMGSAAMDHAGNIAIGYSKSSGSVYPSIAIASRTPAMLPGTMGTETILLAGAGAQTTYNRWGDYTSLRIDPSDDTTFWYTNEYYSKNSPFFNFNWSTAIASFTAGTSTTAPDFSITETPTSLTIKRGSSASTSVTVTASNGSSSVNLSVSGLPKGVSASFSSNPVTATGSSTLKITANRNAATGIFGVTITGNNGSASHGIPLSLTITQ
jgi:hypothetical protein